MLRIPSNVPNRSIASRGTGMHNSTIPHKAAAVQCDSFECQPRTLEMATSATQHVRLHIKLKLNLIYVYFLNNCALLAFAPARELAKANAGDPQRLETA